MSSKYVCVFCGHEFRVNRLTSCYLCGTRIPDEYLPSEKQGSGGWSQLNNSVLGQSNLSGQTGESRRLNRLPSSNSEIQDLVRAQNRTTHAIRSLAIFFFMNLTSGVIGSALIWIGITFQAWLSTFIGSVIAITGFCLALVGGIGELRRSGKGLN